MSKRHASRRSQITGFIRDVIAILIQLRVLIGELVFTVAALYGVCHAYQLLTH